MDYPEYEILISFSHDNDPSIASLKDLMSRYPKIKSKLIIGSHPHIENPKVNNLLTSYQQATYEILLISDSNIRVEPNYLKLHSSLLKENVGLITAVISGRNPNTFFGHMEICNLNTFSARWMLILNALGNPVVMGKSMMFRRSDFNRFGGIKTLGCYIAEDYMAGQAMKYLGKKTEILNCPVEQSLNDYRLKDFFNRQIRWGRLRKSQSIFAILAEPLTTAVGGLIFGAYAFHTIFNFSILSFAIMHLSLWLLLDFIQLQLMGNKITPSSLMAWILREITYFPIWIVILCGKKVDWKGKKIVLSPGGVISRS